MHPQRPDNPTFILRVLHIWQPREGFPQYTMAIRAGDACLVGRMLVGGVLERTRDGREVAEWA